METFTPAAQAEMLNAADIRELEKQYLLQNYARYPLALDRGDGPWVWDLDGNKYLDFITGIGVNALGYNHPRITEVIREQAGLLIHTSNLFFHRYQGLLAKRLHEATGLDRSFFTNSGTESTEGAIKMIRSHGRSISPSKYEIISLENSFHGRSMGALSITGQPKYRADFEPLLSGVRFIERNDIGQLEQAFSANTAGIVIEWIQGEGGILSITDEFAQRARELADQYDALLVFDETQCGVGRTGKYFSYQLPAKPILPDVMVAAKPLACGLPLGVICANERAAKAIRPGMHGSTFGGNALSCRVALEFFTILDELMPQIVRVGDYFRGRLKDLATRFDFIKEVRGVGQMTGMELTKPGAPIVTEAMKNGLLLNCTHETVLRFLPPYTTTEKEVDLAIERLERSLS
jgi:predicted acetylornithine/succinylornithine family transaminase